MQQEIKFAVLKFYHIGHSITGHIASCFGHLLYLISSFCLSFTSCQLMFFTYLPKLLVIHLLFNIYYIFLPGQAEIYQPWKISKRKVHRLCAPKCEYSHWSIGSQLQSLLAEKVRQIYESSCLLFHDINMAVSVCILLSLFSTTVHKDVYCILII